METGNSESASLSASAAMHYKMDPDASAVMSMYYNPHQGLGSTASTSAESPASATTPVTTTAPSSAETLQIPNFSISTSTAASAVESQDLLHPYLGHPSTDMPPTIPEDYGSVFDPTSQAAAAAAAAAANHPHLDPYPDFGLGSRAGGSSQRS